MYLSRVTNVIRNPDDQDGTDSHGSLLKGLIIGFLLALPVWLCAGAVVWWVIRKFS